MLLVCILVGLISILLTAIFMYLFCFKKFFKFMNDKRTQYYIEKQLAEEEARMVQADLLEEEKKFAGSNISPLEKEK